LYETTIIYDEKLKKDVTKSKDLVPMEKCDGVLTHTRVGDGNYPVYLHKDKGGEITKLEIEFC
jgi:hypothetical protein